MKVFVFVLMFFGLNAASFAQQAEQQTQMMTEEEKSVWISSGTAVLEQIYAEFEPVDWEKFSEMEENEPRADDMVQILVGIIRKDDKVLAMLDEKLKSAGSGMRRGILYAIQKNWKLKPEIIHGLAAAARDSQRNVRFHAAMLLSEIQSDKIVPAVAPLLDSEKDEVVRCKLAEGLVKQKSRKGTDLLLSNLKHNDMWIREAAANGLAFSKEKKVYSALEKAIKIEESNIVQSAIISSMNEISGISQQRLWDKYVHARKKKAAPVPEKPAEKPAK